MSPLMETIRSIEIKNEESEERVPTRLALRRLFQLTEEVESGERGEVVLVANLLQQGQRYPSLSGRFIKHLETSQGLLSVSEEMWLQALDTYIEKLGVPYHFFWKSLEKGF